DGGALGADDPFAQLDSTLDAFAALPEDGIHQASVTSHQSTVDPSVSQSSVIESPEVPAEPMVAMVDLEAALDEAAAPAGDVDQAVTLDFDAVMNSLDLSSTDAKLEAAQPQPVAPEPAPVVAEKPAEVPTPAAAPAAAASTPGSYGSSRKTVM